MLNRLFAALYLILVISSCQTSAVKEAQLGDPQRVSQATFVFEPYIAVDPTNPNHLAVIVSVAPAFEIEGNLISKVHLTLYQSTDAGSTWEEQNLFEGFEPSGNGMLAFSPDGNLYVTGLAGLSGAVYTAGSDPEGEFPAANIRVVSSLPGDKPWLTIDPRDGTSYLTFSGFADQGMEESGIMLSRSADTGNNWSKPIALEKASMSELQSGNAMPPFNAQALIGTEKNLAITWLALPDIETWPSGEIRIATSSDRGQTFSAPRVLSEAMSSYSVAFHKGIYYILHRRGTLSDQELVLEISRDNGKTWETTQVNGDLPLYFYTGPAPGISVAPDGTIDVVFYAHGETAPGCIDIEAMLRYTKEIRSASTEGRQRSPGPVDSCTYDTYYTYSKNGGKSFQPLLKLNEHPIRGERFVRIDGRSHAGDYIGIASTDRYAYPIWIATEGVEGTQAWIVRIER